MELNLYKHLTKEQIKDKILGYRHLNYLLKEANIEIRNKKKGKSMTQKTIDLYRCSASEWANLTWIEALKFRIERTKIVRREIREEIDAIGNYMSKECYALQDKFILCEKAQKWNELWLNEALEKDQ